jgi:rhodanese-related sulfurtransferase
VPACPLRPPAWIVALGLLVALGAVVFAAWPRAEAAALSHVSVHELSAAVAEGALVLDVREPFEYAEGRVAGSVPVPLATVGERVDEFDTRAPVYVICRSGNRSLVAAEELVRAGYRDVRNVEGGMIAWAAAGLPIER